MPGGCAVSETGVVPDPAIKNTLRFEFIRGFGELCEARRRENHQPASPIQPASPESIYSPPPDSPRPPTDPVPPPGINPPPPDQPAAPDSTASPESLPQKVSRATNSTGLVCFWRVSRFGSYSYYNLITVAIPLNGELTHPSQRSFRG